MSTEPTSAELSESLEDYLEAILAIENEKRAARAKDVAQRLSVSPPSVTAALQNLAARELINYAPYDLVTLTAKGRKIALGIATRHAALSRFLTDLLLLDPTEANAVACHMEHSLPPHALSRLVEFMDFIESDPHGGVKWSEERGFSLRAAGTDDSGSGAAPPAAP